MLPTVAIRAVCLDPDQLAATLLVFKTLRVGFPNARVVVYAHGLPAPAREAVVQASLQTWCEVDYTPFTLDHGLWVSDMVRYRTGDMVFLDTDVVFWSNVEDWGFETGLAGRLIPFFHCPFTRCITPARLHPSLLFVNHEALKAEERAYTSSFHGSSRSRPVNLWQAVVIPARISGELQNYFIDAAEMAYQAYGGTAFDELHLACYDHLFSGTWIKELAPRIRDVDVAAAHRAALAQPETLRGAWRFQDQWFQKHQHKNP